MSTPDPIDIAVGQRIAARRIHLGLTQAELGRAIGVTFQQVQKYEKGTNRVSASRLQHVADYLSVNVQDLFPVGDQAGAAPTTALDQLAGSPRGHELARLYVGMSAERQASLLSVARALEEQVAA